MSRQSWSVEQDEAITKLVEEFGIEDWTKIAYKLCDYLGMQRRTGKQCRERWYNHLSPNVNKQPWMDQEELLLFTQHKKYGNRWKDISKLFTGRTDNDIKNHFYSTLRRSLRRLNKIIGEKNSTSQMRQIKPSVLSTIMNYIYEQQHSKTDLIESLKDLPILIFQFAKFKPIKMNIKKTNIEPIRQKTNQIFSLINRFNEEYQQNKEFKRNLKSQKRGKKVLDQNQDDVSVKIENIQNNSQNVSVIQESIQPQQQDDDGKFESKYKKKGHHSQQKNNQKTQLSLQHDQNSSYHIQEMPSLLLLSNLVASPKVTIREAPIQFPSHNRIFSLEGEEMNQDHFNQTEEPRKANSKDRSQFQLHNNAREDKERNERNERQLQLINEVIEIHFDR